MKVSIIIVNYNGKDFVGECINSILASNYQDFEIIVVDNGSTDNSVKFINQLKSSRVNELKNNKIIIKLIKSQKNLYFTGGSNLGAEKAKGEKLIFLNSDTVVDKNFIKELVKFAQKNKKYLVQPKILFYNKKGSGVNNYFPSVILNLIQNPYRFRVKPGTTKKPKLFNVCEQKKIIDNVGGRYNFWGFGFAVGRNEKDNGQYDKNTKFDYVNGTAFLIDRQFFLELGGFDNRFRYFYEDVDLSIRARKQGGECWSCWRAVIYHQGSLTFKKTLSVKEIKKRIRKNRQLLRVKRLNRNIKIITNKLRLWELKKTIQKKKFSLLDLGCGNGDFAIMAANEGIKVIGIDKKPPFSTTLHGTVKNLEFKKKNINHLILKEKFEIITMYHVLEHLNQPKKVLKKIKDLLKPKGLLVLEIPLVGNLTESFLGKDLFAYNDNTHQHFFNKKQLNHLINEAGYKIIKKGIVLYEFPLTVITTGFRKSFLQGLVGLFLFLPLKIATLVGLNDEIIRLYCIKKPIN